MNNEILIIKKFESSAKRGTGEAYHILRENLNIDFTNSILKVALYNYAYDGQAEGSRALYVYDLIKLSKQKELIRKNTLEKLKTEQKDTWTLSQLFELAKLYAISGDIEAKENIYERFFTNWIFGSNWLGQEEILELDGFAGLVYIVNKIGKYIEINPNYFEDKTLINSFQESAKEISVKGELDKLAKNDKYIEIYLNHISKCEGEKSKSPLKEEKFNFDTLKNKISNSKKILNIKRYLKNLSESDINHIANLFQEEKNLSKKAEYLRIFIYIKYPGNLKPVIKLAKRKESSNHSLREFSLATLSHIKSPVIRKLAINKIRNSKDYLSFICLLNSNYKEGDAKLLTWAAFKTKSNDSIEILATALTELYTLNKTKECLLPLLEIYKRSNCGIHRNSIVNILLENNILPNQIYHEIEFDSYNETRQLYKKIQNVV
ncbi:hypothetical protein [Leptospira kanakyensis]|uniref:hypothetical protein n=1 Tax=Leptospira kanakyensis TaxID=2484968 RepID=UPI00223C9258|nr:hypothetical protein [Leptospira kanakyensis]MCW7471735.1 hypothetical protein [Leptospira kanakyensis]